MTAKNFATALKNVLVHEGGYVNHPKDPGGATNQGVTQAVYDSYRKSLGKATQSVKNLQPAERDAIYRRRYWDVIKGDDLPDGVDYVVFDGGVNSGNIQSGKWLQRALGDSYKGLIDGQVGPETIRAVKAYPNHDRLIANICEQRMKFLKALKTWSTFGKGWTARVSNVKKVGQQWASGDVGAKSAPVQLMAVAGSDELEPASSPKASILDAQTAPSKAGADAATGAGTLALIATLTAYFSDIIEKLTPYADLPFVNKIVGYATAASLGLVGIGTAWRWYASMRKATLADALNTIPAADQ